jgi:catechol 2,3-dioxygenase
LCYLWVTFDHKEVGVNERIAPAATIGEIHLTVSSLEVSVAFYRDQLGFQVLEMREGSAALGVGDCTLIRLVERPGAKRPRGVTGLYHFAVLLPDRRSLARLLYHLAETNTEVQGASDHGVSEAIYLQDPDGTGIELYRDRKRGEWPVDDIGRLMMDTDELDVDDLVMELRGGVEAWHGLPEGTRIGHVHLHVRNLLEAERFYVGALGFELMQRYGSGAIFVSAGGYHHHIGMNIWAGEGAPPPPEDAAGLRLFEVRLPDGAALEAVAVRLQAAGLPFEKQDTGLLAADPSQNKIAFTI